VSFAAITLSIASQRVFIVVSIYFIFCSVPKLLDTPTYSSRKSGRDSNPILLEYKSANVTAISSLFGELDKAGCEPKWHYVAEFPKT